MPTATLPPFALLVVALLTAPAAAQTASFFTSFEPSEGIAGQSTTVSLGGGLITFSDADGIAGPGNEGEPPVVTKNVAAENPGATVSGGYILAVNGASGATVLDIDFATGASEVSFSAFNDANGQGRVQVFDTLGGLLVEEIVTDSDGFNGDAAEFFSFSSSDFGGALIGSIDFLNNAPAGNPDYIAYLDDFSATVAVPEPTSLATLGLGLLAAAVRRRA